jgi:hypothetical protein
VGLARGLLLCTADLAPFKMLLHWLRSMHGASSLAASMQILGGLLCEVHQLRKAGLGTVECPATRAVGYRQTMAWLDRVAAQRCVSDAYVQQLVFDIAGPSRRLHKGQVTFHRDLEHFHWVDATVGVDAAAAHIEQEFLRPDHVGAQFSYPQPAVQKSAACFDRCLQVSSVCALLSMLVANVTETHERLLVRAGDPGDGGRLTKDEAKVVKRYRTVLKHLNASGNVQEVRTWLTDNGYID